MSYVPGEMERNCVRVHSTTQNGTQLKIYKLFISEIFHVMFQTRGYLKPQKVKPRIRGDYSTTQFHLPMPMVSMFLWSLSLQSVLHTFNQSAQTIYSYFFLILVCFIVPVHLCLLVLCLSSILLFPTLWPHSHSFSLWNQLVFSPIDFYSGCTELPPSWNDWLHLSR